MCVSKVPAVMLVCIFNRTSKPLSMWTTIVLSAISSNFCFGVLFLTWVWHFSCSLSPSSYVEWLFPRSFICPPETFHLHYFIASLSLPSPIFCPSLSSSLLYSLKFFESISSNSWKNKKWIGEDHVCLKFFSQQIAFMDNFHIEI